VESIDHDAEGRLSVIVPVGTREPRPQDLTAIARTLVPVAEGLRATVASGTLAGKSPGTALAGFVLAQLGQAAARCATLCSDLAHGPAGQSAR
jgi:hypothetical protein